MKDSQEVTHFSAARSSKWTQHDTYWLLSLFGTAVGAGILFLPINIGLGGFWPLVLMAVLAFPMTYLSHRGLARFVLSSRRPNADFTDVVEEHFGQNAGRLISLLYFLSIFPILLIYGVGLTNTVDSFLVNQADMVSPPRTLLSGALVFGLIAIMLSGEKIMLRAFAIMVYPLAAILALLSLYLIPYWSMPSFDFPQTSDFLHTVWLAVPVVVFSFSHAAAISSFANIQRRHYGEQADQKSEQILRHTSVVLILFVLLFVFSCVLALSPQALQEAKAQNISVLTYLANVTDNPFIATLSTGRLHRHHLFLPRPLLRGARKFIWPTDQKLRGITTFGGTSHHRLFICHHLDRCNPQSKHFGHDGGAFTSHRNDFVHYADDCRLQSARPA